MDYEKNSEVKMMNVHSSIDNIRIDHNQNGGIQDQDSVESSSPLTSRDWEFSAKHWDDMDDDESKNEIKDALFSKIRVVQGPDFGNLIKMKSTVHGSEPPEPIQFIKDLDLDPTLLDNITTNMKYNNLTPVQKCVIPAIIAGRDLIACSHTGTGKTASFMIPIVNQLLKSGRDACADEAIVVHCNGLRVVFPRVLIISPTRELAVQIFNEARKFSYGTWIRPAVIYGGVQSHKLITQLHSGYHILCATMGKLTDLLDRGKISLSKTRFVVLDEVDWMLGKDDSRDGVERILRQYDLPSDESKQISIFSATLPKILRSIAIDLLIDPLLITIETVTTIPRNLKQKVIFVEEKDKFAKLLDILYNQEAGKTLIFANSCPLVDTIDDALFQRKFPVTSIHGKRTQAEREDAISAFRSNKTPIMVATGVASRGLDIHNIIHVINYDMPTSLEEYVHRVGRTARVGNDGLATTFYNNGNELMARTFATMLKEYNQEIPDFLEPYISPISENETPDVLEEDNKDEVKLSSEFNLLLKKLGGMDDEPIITNNEEESSHENGKDIDNEYDEGGW